MALSFEESKKLLASQLATAATQTTAAMPMVAAEPGIMTLDSFDDTGLIAAYSEWTKSNKYDWYDEYADDRISRVDGNKSITVDPSQINISQEENSQYIPFEMPRYYDGFDLMSTDLEFWYKTSDGIVGSSRAINVTYDSANIRLGWLIDARTTHVAGGLTFEIRGIGVNSKGNAYTWKTKTCDVMTVLQSLIDDKTVQIDDTWVQEIVTKVAESVAENIAGMQVAEQVAAAENAASRANNAADRAENALSNAGDVVSSMMSNYYTKSEVDLAIENVEVDLSDYALKSEIPTTVSELYNDAGYLTEHQSLDGYATEDYVQEQIYAIPDVDLSNYATKDEIPTAVSELTNDAGYLTEHQSLEDYVTKEDL